ncbi:MAG: type VI secretion system tube protein Hcp [Acidobacteriota bacterium]|nr:type VI secretion system tube protein Hcp [Acidobacteriota bacterium]
MHALKPLYLLTLLAAAPAFAQMSVTITMPTTPVSLSCVINGVTTSTFPVTSASFSMSNTASIGGGPGGGGGPGKVSFSDYKLTKNSDSCSIPLFTQLAKGNLIRGNVIINYYGSAASEAAPVPILGVYLTNVLITKLDLESGTAETFSLTYEGIRFTTP